MKKKVQLLLFFCLVVFSSVTAQETQQFSENPSWDELKSRPYPQWFKDAKLGIFIHWGLYSVPSMASKEGYAEWYLRGVQLQDSARLDFQHRIYGDDFTYRDFKTLFKAELWDPNQWAHLFKASGAKYVLFVAKHHDGYCLWDSEYAPGWNSVETGPHRDLVGDLTKAVRKEGLEMGLYYSLPEWNNELHKWDTDDPRKIGPYVDQHMIPQFKELISRYKPTVLFTDGEWWNSAEEWHARQLIGWYYNTVGNKAITNNRWGSGSDIGFLTPEYSSGIVSKDRPWSECRGLGRSFGLNRNETLDAYMTPEELIHFFVKAVANGGGITLNVGPKADGQIPLLQQERLIQLGDWIGVNQEAIYSSYAWNQKTHEERPVIEELVDSVVSFNWVRNRPIENIKEDDFTVTWEGYISPNQNGEYLFDLKADDGAKLWIDDRLIVDNSEESKQTADGNVMTNNEATNKFNRIFLNEGTRYKIKIDYFEKKRNASVSLKWKDVTEVSSELIVVPNDVLFVDETTNQHGLRAKYQSMEDYMVYTVNNNSLYAILLEWPGDVVRIPIDKPLRNTKITLLGEDRPLKWRYRKGAVEVDLSSFGPDDLPCRYGWTLKIENYLEK
ncbi:alpha-L-fucosidase [Halosquirtibacter xylanolyticus]|uniref:alpha-L-fucosidase n=1 Tax=Halosquirtibacter xylanolyticus TaxID=3374599 RepID=UPI00374911F4|nr:alpha-L-fucosidase [Prolixibacteraceae bacterium]